mmetsp:Transcript_14634/g.19470  ORF Transcript_14634/g.19470 Transcript_14634/m.19470 type:complete len:359 (+) Transcript_14634:35-1111(+)
MAEATEDTPLIPSPPETAPAAAASEDIKVEPFKSIKEPAPEEIRVEPEEIKEPEEIDPIKGPEKIAIDDDAGGDIEAPLAEGAGGAVTDSFVPKIDYDAFQASAAVAAAKTAEYSKVAYVKGVEYGKKGAVVASVKAKEMSEFVMDGPIGFRLLAFIGGCGVFWFSVVSMVNMYYNINIWRMIASMYNIFLGFSMLLMESTAVCKRTPWRNEIYTRATFLRTTFGRGMSYLFIGINMTAQDFGIFAFFTGVYMVAVGVILSLVGYFTQKKLSNLHHHLNNEEEVMVMFDLMDADGDGTLDQEEFAELCKHLGVPLRKTELLAVFDVIDTSDVGQRKNTITKEEFLHWWSEWDELADVV